MRLHCSRRPKLIDAGQSSGKEGRGPRGGCSKKLAASYSIFCSDLRKQLGQILVVHEYIDYVPTFLWGVAVITLFVIKVDFKNQKILQISDLASI